MYLLLAEPGEGRSCCLLSSSVCPCALAAGARPPPATPQWRRSEHPGDDSTSPARKAQVSMHASPTLDAIILTTCVLCVFQPTTDSSGRRRQPGAQSGLHLVLVRGWIRVPPLPPRYLGPLTQGLMEGCALCLGACLYGPLFVFQFFCRFAPSPTHELAPSGRRNCHPGDGANPPGCLPVAQTLP